MTTPRRPLAHFLLANHVGLVLVLTMLLLVTGAGTMQTAVIGHARAEAERAVSDARRQLQAWRRELGISVGLLSSQAGLKAALEAHQVDAVHAVVSDFRRRSGIEYIEVRRAGRTIAALGEAPPSLVKGMTVDESGKVWRVEQTDVDDVGDASVLVADRLGDGLAASRASEFIRVELQTLPLADSAMATVPAGEGWRSVLRRVAASGEPETVEALAGNAAARVVVLRDELGRPSALLSARVAEDWAERRALEWLAKFAVSSLGMGLLMLGASVVIAARIARPFAQLSRHAEQLARGDLDSPIPVPAGAVAEAAALAVSLDEMRRQVGALATAERHQREELDALLDGVDEGIVGIGDGARIHYANRQFLALVGRSRNDVLGQSLESLLGPMPMAGGDAAADIQTPQPMIERGRAAQQARPLKLRRLPAKGGRQVVIVREETAVEAARAMRDRILANLSHEFQTPLSAQLASIELLRDHLGSSADPIAIQLADAQYRGALRLSQLVDNLLDSVRIESGEMRLRRQSVDLITVINGAVDLMRPLIDQRGQRVVLSLAPGPMLTADAQRLFSVMVNLLANANKFAPDQTTIWIELAWSSDGAAIWVEDEGPGLPVMHAHDDLFAPFKRAPDAEPSERGSGLGLAIVHAIVAAHGGEVRVAAPVHRRGARLGVVLPIEPTV